MFRSKPFIAILIAHFCNNFGWYMLLIELPTFMNQILKFDMSSVKDRFKTLRNNIRDLMRIISQIYLFINRMQHCRLCRFCACGSSL